jgi:two-component system response regulator AlgR
MPAIVFCTAYDEHALQAIQSQAKGYLLKPIAKEDLETVLENVTKLTQAQLTHLEKKNSWKKKCKDSKLLQKPIEVWS